MTPIVISVAAEEDLDRRIEWLAERAPKAAQRAADVLFAAIGSLTDFPEAGVPIGRGDRDLAVRFGRDGFVVRYRYDGARVVVLRVFHGRQDR